VHLRKQSLLCVDGVADSLHEDSPCWINAVTQEVAHFVVVSTDLVLVIWGVVLQPIHHKWRSIDDIYVVVGSGYSHIRILNAQIPSGYCLYDDGAITVLVLEHALPSDGTVLPDSVSTIE
jgi:hypothetical protein